MIICDAVSLPTCVIPTHDNPSLGQNVNADLAFTPTQKCQCTHPNWQLQIHAHSVVVEVVLVMFNQTPPPRNKTMIVSD